MQIDHDKVLDMWFAGETTDKIAIAIGTVYVATVANIVSRHRAMGDPRAVRRQLGKAYRTGLTNNIGAYQRRKKLRRFPAKPSDLLAAIQSYTGPITYCPPGFHAGHRPTCLAAVGL